MTLDNVTPVSALCSTQVFWRYRSSNSFILRLTGFWSN